MTAAFVKEMNLSMYSVCVYMHVTRPCIVTSKEKKGVGGVGVSSLGTALFEDKDGNTSQVDG